MACIPPSATAFSAPSATLRYPPPFLQARSTRGQEIGIVLPNNQRQHRTLHTQKDVGPTVGRMRLLATHRIGPYRRILPRSGGARALRRAFPQALPRSRHPPRLPGILSLSLALALSLSISVSLALSLSLSLFVSLVFIALEPQGPTHGRVV